MAGDAIQLKQQGVQEGPAPTWEAPAATAPPADDGQWRPIVWPGLLVAVLLSAAILGTRYFQDNLFVAFMTMFMGPMIGAGLIVLWWLTLSRTGWIARIGMPLLAVGIAALAWVLADKSFKVGVMMYGLWAAAVVWPLWLFFTGGLSPVARMLGIAFVLALVFAACDLFRLDGVDGSMGMEISWRWDLEAEDHYYAQRGEQGEATIAESAIKTADGDWLGFRGQKRDGIAAHATVGETNWSEKPPELLWQQRVGPGWSSFVVVGDRLYTQEQVSKEQEGVVCYQASTGKVVWTHKDDDRFWEMVSGAGPRATPTFYKGRIYALGGNGLLNCLDAATGKMVWKKAANVVEDSGADRKKLPVWGYSASPCIVDGIVSVYAGGRDEDAKAVVAYDAETGKLKWASGYGGHGYASTQLATVAGKRLLLVSCETGLLGLEPKTGEVLIDYQWAMGQDMARCIQTPVVSKDEVLVSSGFKNGTRRVKFTPSKGELEGKDVWESKAISAYFNDMVIHDGHVYGFDGDFLTCVDLKDGETKWRRRGFGNGQVLFLPKQKLLLVQAEKTGHVALVEATPDEYREKGKFKAIKGKTWNHPVIAHGRMFLRNSEWMMCYKVK
jgi:outer membrane protein assembly factor BamB